MTTTDLTDLIDLAVEHLDATRYEADTKFAYTDQGTPGEVYLVTADDMEDLGRRLARGDADAYSHWRADTPVDSVSADRMVAEWRSQGATITSVRALRDDAASHGDLLTVAACDHLADRIRGLIEETA